MLPEDIRNMDFGQASMPHAPEAQTPEVPYDTTTSAPDRPAIPLSPDMLSGNLRENDSEKSGIEFSFDAFGYTQQVELVQESYADGNLAVTAYLSDPTDESFGQPWSSVTVNFGSPLQQDATVFLDTNNMGEAMLSKISQLGAFTGQFMRSGFCSYPAFTFDTEVMDNMRDLNEFVSADHSSLIVGFLIVRVEFDSFHFHFPFRGNISCIIASFVSVRFPDFTGSLPFTLTNPSKRILNTGSVVSTALCLANGS